MHSMPQLMPLSLFFIITPISTPPAHDMLKNLLEVIEFLAIVFFSHFRRTIQFGFS